MKRLTVLAALVIAGATATVASAHYTTVASGPGSASTGSLGVPVITVATPGAGTVSLSWTTVAAPAAGSVQYFVTRNGGAPTGDCPTVGAPTSVTSCTDTGLTTGTYHYTVTAVFKTWTQKSATTDATVASGAATRLVFLTAPQTLTAGVTSSTITIERQDASGTPVTSGSTTVDLSTSSSGGAIRNTADSSTIASVSIPGGTADASFKYTDTAAGSPRITAADHAAVLPAGSQTETVNAANASKVVFLSGAQALTAGVTSSTITVERQDQYGNPATNGSLTVNLTTGSTAGVFRNTADTAAITSVAIAAGSSDGLFKYKDTLVGSPQLTASSTLPSATQTETVNAANGAKLVLLTAPQTLTAGVTSSTITVERQDQFGNPAGDGTITVGLSTSSAPGVFRNTADSSTITSVSIPAGSSDATFKYKDTLAGSPQITASSGTLTSASQTETVNAAAFSRFALALASPQVDGVAFTGTSTLTVQDAFGNTVTTFNASSDNVTITTTLSGTVSGLSGGTKLTSAADFTNGVATLTGLTYTGTIGTGTFTATSVSGKTGTSGSVTVGVGALHHFALSLASPQVDGVAFTGTSTLTAQDVGNNTITGFNASTSNVTLTTTLGGTIAGLSGGNKLTAAGDFANGVATLSGLTYTGTIGTGTFTATSNGKTGTSGNVTIGIGALDHFAFSLASPQTDGVAFTGTNTLTAQDVGNNTITGFNASASNVTLTTALSGTISGLSGGSKLTAAGDFTSGVATLPGLTYTGTTGTGTFTATSGTKTGTSNSVTINVGALDHFAFSLATPQTDGVAFTGTDTLTAKDVGNNTITTFSAATSNVTLTTTLGGTISGLSGGSKLTAAGDFTNGVATLTGLTYTGTIGTGTFTATSATKAGTSNSVTINVGALDHFAFVLASPQTSGVAFTGTNTLTAQDVGNNTVTTFNASTNNVTVTAGSGLSGTVGFTTGATGAVLNAAGDFTSGVANLTAGGLGMIFNGTGSGAFTATSGGKTGTSGTVTVTGSGPVITALGPASTYSGSPTSSFQTSSYQTTASGSVILVFVTTHGSSSVSVSGGLGTSSFSNFQSTGFGSGANLTAFWAPGAAKGTNASLTVSGTGIDGAVVHVFQVTGANTSWPFATGTVTMQGGSGNPNVTLGTPASPSNIQVMITATQANTTFTKPTGYTALQSTGIGTPLTLGDFYDDTPQSGLVTVTPANGGPWAAMGIEIAHA
jgi:hypothetical protein